MNNPLYEFIVFFLSKFRVVLNIANNVPKFCVIFTRNDNILQLSFEHILLNKPKVLEISSCKLLSRFFAILSM